MLRGLREDFRARSQVGQYLLSSALAGDAGGAVMWIVLFVAGDLVGSAASA
jgi:hypothetical protein